MTSPDHTHLLTISDLSDRTGVPPATLRSWELRYGFPHPARLPGGHRRYTEQDVAAVLEVLRHRTAGLALGAAVRRVGTDGPPSLALRSRSVYAELRRRHPELIPQRLSKASLVALSHAIEDECCARAEEPVLFGGFQRAMFLEQARARWTELARTARAAVVFAALAEPSLSRPGALTEVALPREAPLNREWLLVCDADDLPACMAAVERPGQDTTRDAQRRFDVVWTVDPQAVRHAGRVATALADEYRPDWRASRLPLLADEPPPASADLHRASQLLNRMMGYLDASH